MTINKEQGKVVCILVLYDIERKIIRNNYLNILLEDIYRNKGVKKVILVNNDEMSVSDEIYESLNHEFRRRVKIVSTQVNRGLSGGFNFGVGFLDPTDKYAAFVAVDCFNVGSLNIDKIINVFCKDEVAVVHPKSMFEDNNFFNESKDTSFNQFRAYSRKILRFEEAREIEDMLYMRAKNKAGDEKLTETCRFPLTFTVFDVAKFKNVGGFDEDYLAGGENIDLGMRFILNDYKIIKINSEQICHRRLSLRLLGQGKGTKTNSLEETVNNGKDLLKKKYGSWEYVYFKKKYGKAFKIAYVYSKLIKLYRRGVDKWPYQNW